MTRVIQELVSITIYRSFYPRSFYLRLYQEHDNNPSKMLTTFHITPFNLTQVSDLTREIHNQSLPGFAPNQKELKLSHSILNGQRNDYLNISPLVITLTTVYVSYNLTFKKLITVKMTKHHASPLDKK